MGAGASTLPEKLTEEEMKKVCCDMYDERFYKYLKDDDGFVDRDKFALISSDAKEQEVMLLFLSFCDGSMDASTFVKFCKHGKLFSKSRFSRKQVEAHKKLTPTVLVFPINYITFRFTALPYIAAARGNEVSQLITRLSRAEFPSSRDPHTETASTLEPVSDHSPGNSIKREHLSAKQRNKDAAVLRIQNMQRTRLAKSDSARRKELRKIESLTLEEKAANKVHVQCSPEVEAAVSKVFAAFSPSGEMTADEFVKLCYDSQLIPFDASQVDFTSRDAKFLFQKVIASHFDPVDNAYLPGVIHGKRIVYSVFRDALLHDIAEKKNMKIEELLFFLGAHGGVIRRLYYDEEGPNVISLLDRTVIDAEMAENAKQYEHRVVE
jgi:hypothetical protein